MKLAKQCTRCKRNFPASMFLANRKRCKHCMAEYHLEYMRQYRQRPEVKLIIQKQDAIYKNRPEVKNRNRENRSRYYARPEVRERNRKYAYERSQRPEVKEHIATYLQRPEVRERNRERNRVRDNNRQARKRSLPDTLTSDQWQHALNYFDGCCAVCGRQLNDIFGEFKAAADHWIPLSYRGDDNPGTVAANIIPLCHGIDGCNNSKQAAIPDEWLERKFGKRKGRRISKKIQDYFDSIEELT